MEFGRVVGEVEDLSGVWAFWVWGGGDHVGVVGF
jgi:hypothetical protein